MVESQIVDLVVAGSNPVIHPEFLKPAIFLGTETEVFCSRVKRGSKLFCGPEEPEAPQGKRAGKRV